MVRTQYEVTAIYDFANRSLRDQADRDYIAARVLHVHNLDTQFLWSASQSVEKYLKAILLYNFRSAKGLGHDLRKALDRVKAIPDFDFQLSAAAVEYVRYLDEEGQNRYFDFPTDLRSDALLRLDRTVWEIRRYCHPMSDPPPGWQGTDAEWRARQFAYVNNPARDKQRHKLRIIGGLLEETLKKPSKARDALVWKNFCFGRRRKNKIRYGARWSSSNPTHFMHEEWFPYLEALVDFPKNVRNYFKQAAAAKAPVASAAQDSPGAGSGQGA
jgi:HEPN domain-containing protein